MFGRAKRQYARIASSKVLGLFAAVWVSLALQPCAVAAVAEQSCPHCPPEIEAAPDVIREHCGTRLPEPAVALENCVTAQSDCLDIEDGLVNVRVEMPDFDDDMPVLPTSVPDSRIHRHTREHPANATGPPERPGRPVPLYILNCVYLD